MERYLLSKARVWSDMIERVKVEKFIPTLKGKASAKLSKIEEDYIVLEFYHKKDLKKAIVYKKDIELAIDVLAEKGKVRQKDITTTRDQRYVLGVMKLLPYFEVVREDTSYLVLRH